MTTVYHIQGDLTFKTVEQLRVMLAELANERSASQRQYELALERAIAELENYSAWGVTYRVTIDETLCLQPLPCCGIKEFSYQTQVFQNCQGEGCYQNVSGIVLEHGQLRVPRHAYGDGLLTVYGFNRSTANQQTVSGADLVDDEYHIYIKGQPDIPSFGFLRICEDLFFYRCKSGYEWTPEVGLTAEDYTIQLLSTDEVDSTEGLTVDPDFTGLGKYRPPGANTVLYAVPVDECGRVQQVYPDRLFPGTTVEFPIAYSAHAYANLLLAVAANHLYRSLISSCTSTKDVERFSKTQEYYQGERQRLLAKLPRTKKPKVKAQNVYRTADALRPERPAFDARGIPYQYSSW